jgi:hypothetical protein
MSLTDSIEKERNKLEEMRAASLPLSVKETDDGEAGANKRNLKIFSDPLVNIDQMWRVHLQLSVTPTFSG